MLNCISRDRNVQVCNEKVSNAYSSLAPSTVLAFEHLNALLALVAASGAVALDPVVEHFLVRSAAFRVSTHAVVRRLLHASLVYCIFTH